MSNQFTIPKKEYKNQIRQIDLGGLTIGGESSLAFMHSETQVNIKPLTITEILYNVPANYSEILKSAWGECVNNPVTWTQSAIEKGTDVIAIRFNIAHQSNIESEITKSKEILRQILTTINIPLVILGSGKDEVDTQLIPELAKAATRKCTLGIITEDNYKEIIPLIKDTEHNVIARTPIDINLAKQLNILITELGFDANKIIIDPNTGALGYGLDYAYSIIERIKLAALEGDNMLNMPVISFVGEEAWKTKEAKSSNVQSEWGDINKRAITWECLTASSLLTAGADLVVMYHPESINKVKNFINKA